MSLAVLKDSSFDDWDGFTMEQSISHCFNKIMETTQLDPTGLLASWGKWWQTYNTVYCYYCCCLSGNWALNQPQCARVSWNTHFTYNVYFCKKWFYDWGNCNIFDDGKEVDYRISFALNINYSILDVSYLKWWQDGALECSRRQLKIMEESLDDRQGAGRGGKVLGFICKRLAGDKWRSREQGLRSGLGQRYRPEGESEQHHFRPPRTWHFAGNTNCAHCKHRGAGGDYKT